VQFLSTIVHRFTLNWLQYFGATCRACIFRLCCIDCVQIHTQPTATLWRQLRCSHLHTLLRILHTDTHTNSLQYFGGACGACCILILYPIQHSPF